MTDYSRITSLHWLFSLVVFQANNLSNLLISLLVVGNSSNARPSLVFAFIGLFLLFVKDFVVFVCD